jgi:NADH-quinone oxidoreductase subunit L
MFLAVGTGGYVAAIFHMVTHAFFKALMFLGAGSVIHGMHEEQDMRRMGALRKVMPITAITFMVGWLAISGVPPFSGFWSKDEILSFALHDSPALYAIGLFTAGLTAFYMSRLVYMTFFGDARWGASLEAEAEAKAAHSVSADAGDGEQGQADHLGEATVAASDAGPDPSVASGAVATAHDEHHGVQPHESPWLMTVPLVVLAVLAAVGGVLNLPFGDLDFLTQWLHPVVGANEAEFELGGLKLGIEMLASTVVALTGIFLAYLVYLKRKLDARRIELPLFANGWYIDSSITGFMGGPGRKLFDLIALFDRVVIDGAVNGVGRATRGGAARIRGLQNGLVRSYALFIAIGAALLVIFVLTQVTF